MCTALRGGWGGGHFGTKASPISSATNLPFLLAFELAKTKVDLEEDVGVVTEPLYSLMSFRDSWKVKVLQLTSVRPGSKQKFCTIFNRKAWAIKQQGPVSW